MERSVRFLLKVLFVLICAAGAHGALVTSSGYTNAFSSQPQPVDWTTLSVGGGSGDITTAAGLDDEVQNTSIASITVAVASDPGNPPAAGGNATWSSAGLYLQTRPTGNRATMLMCRLTNGLSVEASAVTILYDYSKTDTVTEEVDMHRVLYSLTGAPGSWTLIPSLSTATAGRLTATVSLNWPANSPLYIVWADDNGSGTPDTSQRIDNFSVRATPGAESPATITSHPTNLTVNERAPSAFAVTVIGNPPPTIQWYTNGVAWAGATNASLEIGVTPLAYDGLQFYAVAQNVASNVTYMATSSVATLSVIADTAAPVLLSATPAGLIQLVVAFSEQVAAASATNLANYAITGWAGSLTISNAQLDASQTNVILTVSPMTPQSNYVLTVNGVTDQSAAANMIAANSQAAFTAAAVAFEDIGAPVLPGSVTSAGNGFNLSGGGTNIAGGSDQFTFAYQLVAGDFDVEVRLNTFDGQDAYALAGLMARETLAANSRFAAAAASPSLQGTYFMNRSTAGANATFGNAEPVNYPQTWLRLTRVANTFTAYTGWDGQNWVVLGSVTIAMPSGVYVGQFVCGASTSQVATVAFRDLGPGTGGTVIPTLPKSDREILGPSNRRSGLVVSEIMYHPRRSANTNDLTFIEIYNSDIVFQDISGYRVTGEVSYTFPPGTILNAGKFIVVAANPAALESAYGLSGVYGPYSGTLSRAGGTVRLRNNVGAELVEVEYETAAPWPASADGAGHSLVLARPSYGEGDPRAWAASDTIGGSPGRMEPFAFDPARDVVINEFLARTVEPAEDFIELYNHSTTPVDISGCWLSDSADTNKFRIPDGTTLGARGFIVFTESQLGFRLSASDEKIFFVNSNQTRVLDAIVFEGQAEGVSSGRVPDGSANWRELAAVTPGTTNAAPLLRPIVINEIMYDPISGDDDDEFVELYNRGTNTVDLSGWRFIDGIDFAFAEGVQMTPGSYLVVARNRNRMLANYPDLNATNLVGNFDGSLRNAGERVALAMRDYLVNTNGTTNTIYVVVNEVSYGRGRWGDWAHGGGSSLELTDPHSDNQFAANWTDSDENDKSQWVTVVHQETIDHVYPRTGTSGNLLNEVQLMLLGRGEALVDDIEVKTNAITGQNLVLNGNFETGLTGWLIQGNHVRTTLEPVGPNNPSQSMRIRASSAGDNGANRVEKDLTVTINPTGVSPNIPGFLGARMRWLRGSRDLLIRLHGGGLERVFTLPIPKNLGSPGLRNSRAVDNAGPVIEGITHAPVLPAAAQDVTVTARVTDSDGVAQVVLRYRNDTDSPATSIDVPMNDAGTNADLVAGDGIYSGVIPGQAAGRLVAFHVRATDGAAPAVTSAYPNVAERHEALVRFGETTPLGTLGLYRFWMTASNMNTWTTRERLSNEALEGTMVSGTRVIHGAGARYRGSPFIRPGYNTPTGSPCAYVWELPPDEPYLNMDELNLDSLEPSGRDATALREPTAFVFVRQMGLPFSYQRYIHVYINGVTDASRGIWVYTDSQQPDGDYMEMWFPDGNSGDIYKVDDWFEFDDTPARELNKSASLQNYTTTGGVKKQARYRWNWEKKINGGYSDDYSTLFDGVNALNAPDAIYVQQVEGSFYIEEWLTALALRHVVGDWDGYGYDRGKNQFTYRPPGGKFHMLLWDLDFSIGSNGGHPPSQNLFQVAQGGPTGENDMPEMARMYNNATTSHPHMRRIYLRALKRIADGPLQTNNYMPTLDARFRALRANGVTASTSPYVGSGAQGISLPDWINQRRDNTYSQIGAAALAAVFDVATTTVTVSDSNLVTIAGTAPLDVKTIIINGVEYPVTWSGNPPTAWSVRLPLSVASNQLAVVGVDLNGNPITATNFVAAQFAGTNPDPVGQIVINEIMFNPATPNAEYIELFNTASNYTFDLRGWRVNGIDYEFPAGSYILPRSFLLLVKDRAAFSTSYTNQVAVFDQYNGTLQGNGETISLVRPGATTNGPPTYVDRVRYEPGLPWPLGADGTGSAYQLLDPGQENARAGNWFSGFVPAVYCCGGTTPAMTNDGWRFASVTGSTGGGTGGSGSNKIMRLLMNLSSVDTNGASAIIDDMQLVAGTNAGVGYNFIRNGDFETTPLLENPPLTNSWFIGTNYTNTAIISDITHSGNGALKMVCSTFGNVSPRLIAQYLSPAPVSNAIHTLSFWFWASNSAQSINIRLQNSSGVNVTTNLGITVTPEVTIPPTLVSPATNYLSPGLANPTTNLPPFPPLWINEVQADNLTGLTDNAGDREPWIEIYNTSTNVVSLEGLYLSPNYTNLTNWAFPAGASIGPKEFLVVFCDDEPEETSGTNYHTNFRLPSGSGSVALARLYNDAPQTLDYVNYAAGADRSYGSFPDGQPFDRQEFYYVTPRGTNDGRAAPIVVKINEWMASNVNAVEDPADGDNDDWFELYNPGTNDVDLAGSYLTDDLSNPTKFLITTNMAHIVPAGGYLLVWADNETGQNMLAGVPRPDMHVGWQLARAGEGIGLFAADGTTIDAITFTNEVDDISEGRCPDGSANIIDMPAFTPKAANVGCGGGNTPPVLNPIGNKALYIGQTLTFTATASDSDLPAQSLTFSLDPGAPAGAAIGAGSGVFTWTPSSVGTVNVTVRVTDSGVPAASASETIAVEVRNPPGFANSVRNGANLEMTWDTIAGKKYAVDYTENLNPPISWTPVSTNTAGGTSMSYTNSTTEGQQRFFRIRTVD